MKFFRVFFLTNIVLLICRFYIFGVTEVTEFDTVAYKVVVLGDSNTAGSKNMADILNALPEIAVYNESKEGRTTYEIAKLLENNESLQKAIAKSSHIIVYAGGNSPQHAIEEGLETIYQKIKELNYKIAIIGVDIQLTTKSDLQPFRKELNNTISKLENYLIFHFETNNELDAIEYSYDGIHLSTQTKIDLITRLAADVFDLSTNTEFVKYQLSYEKNTIADYCNLEFSDGQNPEDFYLMNFPLPEVPIDSSYIRIDSEGSIITTFNVYNKYSNEIDTLYGIEESNENELVEIEYFDGKTEKCKKYNLYDGNSWRIVYMPESISEIDGYIFVKDGEKLENNLLFPKFVSPLENIDDDYKMPKVEYYKLIAGTNMPKDSSENYIYQKVCEWEAYIKTLSIEEQMKWAYWKKVFSKNVYYRTNPFLYEIPENMIEYTNSITYTQVQQDSIGEFHSYNLSQSVTIVPLPDILVMYPMLYSSFYIEKQFQRKYPSYIMNLTKLAIGNNETRQCFGKQTSKGVITTKGAINPEDMGALQLNFTTADYYSGINPDFNEQFFKLNQTKRTITFYSWLTEQMIYTYVIARSKVQTGFTDELNFTEIAQKASSWHRTNLPAKHRYVLSLKTGLKLYDSYLSQFFPKEDDYVEIMNEVIRINLQKNFSNDFLAANQFQKVEKVVVDNQNVLSDEYPDYLRKKLMVKYVDVKKYNEQMFTQYIISPQYCKPAMENDITRFYIDNDGHIEYTFQNGETLYQLSQNRIRKWILYNNSVADEYNKGEKFILCAEKSDDIWVLNEKFEYDQLPSEIRENCTSEIFENIRDSIGYEYFLFYEFQNSGYSIKVRVGDYALMNEKINDLKNQYSEEYYSYSEYKKMLKALKLDFRLIYNDDTFYIPPTDFFYLKEQDGFYVLGYYLETLSGKNELEKEVDFMQTILEQIRTEDN